MNKIQKIKYLKIEFSLASPLAVSSGENNTTDKDLIRNAKGMPYIPASAIAGVIRECLNEDEYSDYLGFVKIDTGEHKESKVLFYDANLKIGSPCHISVRDSVALDEYKTAKKGAKFDMEVLEAGAEFVTYIEQTMDSDSDEDYIDKIIGALFKQPLRFGGKTMRGYGETQMKSMQVISFKMEDLAQLNDWLDFDVYNDKTWKESYTTTVDIPKDDVKPRQLRIGLKQKGGISIRRNTTDPGTNGEKMPDMEQLTSHYAKEEIPVIPGTSWAGAFSHRMSEFGINVSKKGSIFGFVRGDGQNDKARSKIRFGESRIDGGYDKQISRNSIDRFTGGTVDSALFTEKTHYGGTTELVIEWMEKDVMLEKEASALAAAIADLHFGFLAVGGETSIGRGLFEITSINGEPLLSSNDGSKEYEAINDAMIKVGIKNIKTVVKEVTQDDIN